MTFWPAVALGVVSTGVGLLLVIAVAATRIAGVISREEEALGGRR